MKLFDIIKKVGTGLIKNIVPGSGLLIDTVNELLPKGKRIGKDATGDELSAAIESLPPDKRASVMEKEFDVEIAQIQEAHGTANMMLEMESKSTHTTRPYIAKQSFHVIAFVIVVTVSLFAYGVFTGNKEMVLTMMINWKFPLAVIGPLVTLLWAYFGVLKSEHRNRLDAAGGNMKPTGIAGLISMFKK